MSFDDPNLVANAGLLLVATLAVRLELEGLVSKVVRLTGRVADRGRDARSSPRSSTRRLSASVCRCPCGSAFLVIIGT